MVRRFAYVIFKKSAILVFVVFIFVLASCNESNTVSISKYKNMSVKEVVNELDRTNPKVSLLVLMA